MARDFAATRTLLNLRTVNDIFYETNSSSGTRFDSAATDGCVAIANVVNAAIQVPLPTARNSLWLSMLYSLSTAQTSSVPSNKILLEFLDSNLVVQFIIDFASTSLNTTRTSYRRAAGLFADTNNFEITQGLNRFVIELDTSDEGVFRMWSGTTLLKERTWTDGDMQDISFIRVKNPMFLFPAPCYVSQLAVDTEDLRGYSFPNSYFTDDGFYTDGTGDAVDAADLDLTTAKSLPAVDDIFTGTRGSVTFPAGAIIEGVTVNAIARMGSPVTQVRPLFRRGSTDFTDGNFSPVFSAGYEIRSKHYAVNPATTVKFTPATFNDTEFGFEAIAP